MKKTIIVALVLVAGAAGAYILAEHRDEAKEAGYSRPGDPVWLESDSAAAITS